MATPHSGAIPSGGAGRHRRRPLRQPGGAGGRRPAGGGFGATGQSAGWASPAHVARSRGRLRRQDRRPAGGGGAAGGGRRGAGGLLNCQPAELRLVHISTTALHGYRWVLATVGANEAAGYQLATGDAVMAIGGFNGTDPAPTLAQFEKLVAAGEIHYFIAGGGGGGRGAAGGLDGASEPRWQPRSAAGSKPTSRPPRSGA